MLPLNTLERCRSFLESGIKTKRDYIDNLDRLIGQDKIETSWKKENEKRREATRSRLAEDEAHLAAIEAEIASLPIHP